MIEDTPLEAKEYDRLGFGDMARHMTSSLVKNDLSRGFVVGVEGPWGSGKSSLVNLALEEMKQQQGGPKVVRFAPWLVGNRNELLSQLFSSLEPVILESVPTTERQETELLLGRYAQASSTLAALADVAEVGGVPWAGIVSNFLRNSRKKALDLSKRSLGDLNENLREKLRKINRPIVVFIDDIDRLEPTEAAEVLRLVKAVADFPNVAYVLAYDVEVLAKSIERAIGISNGRAYLEKIVQGSFKVPKAMSFDLHNWLKSDFLKLLDGIDIDQEATARLEFALSQWPAFFIETPRDVIRALNSLKLNFMPVRDQVDPADMLFLQIIRSKNSKLFSWTENYASDLSAIGDWGQVTPDLRERMGQSLIDAIDKNGQELVRFIYALSEHLPGMSLMSLHQKDSKFEVYSGLNVDELRGLGLRKRLASSSHFRYYFSFSAPPGSVSDSELSHFLGDCETNPENALVRFRQMIDIQRPQGGRLAEVLLDRIRVARDRISSPQTQGILWVLGESLDELIPFSKTVYGRPNFLQGNRQEIFGLIANVNDRVLRANILKSLFSDGKSMAWLVGIIRQANFEHETKGSRNPSQGDSLLSLEEFKLIKGAFIKRLKKANPSDLLKVPYFLSLMFAWHQAGDKKGALEWIAQATRSDAGFLNVQEKMKSWSESSSDGVQYKLRLETINTFFGGVPTVQERLKKISVDSNDNPDLRHRAKVLLEKFDDDAQ